MKGSYQKKVWHQTVRELKQSKPNYRLYQLCRLFGYSRQAYHQHLTDTEHALFNHHLIVEQVKQIRQRHKRCGGKKLFLMLQPFFKKHSIKMGRDAFFRLLEQYDLLIRKRKYRPFTTNSKHFFYKYSNLVTGLQLKRAHQLWVSDITYIPVAGEFAYLSLITDAYSRKIVGFYLSEDMTAKACTRALQMAINQKPPKAATIHHSDRGLQYCSNEYTDMLKQHQILISMTKNGDPYENAIAERVNGILKQEYLPEYFNNINQARTDIAKAVLTYNYHRLHASIDMMTPDQAHTQTGKLTKRWKSRYAKKKELIL